MESNEYEFIFCNFGGSVSTCDFGTSLLLKLRGFYLVIFVHGFYANFLESVRRINFVFCTEGYGRKYLVVKSGRIYGNVTTFSSAKDDAPGNERFHLELPHLGDVEMDHTV